MTQTEFNMVIENQMMKCNSLLVTKGTEYALDALTNRKTDRLAHFKKAAILMNTTPKIALLGMLSKHLVSIADMCRDEAIYPTEKWEEKITDSINYLLILRAMVEEEFSEKNRSENIKSRVY